MKNNNTKTTLAFFAVIIGILIVSPVVYGYLICPVDKKFLGITGLYPIEQFYYLSVGPTQALKGHLIFADKYFRIAPENVLINPIANIIGSISAITNFSLTTSFNIFRLLSSLLLIVSFCYLAKQFISSTLTLFLSLCIYSFSGGFGPIFNLFNFSAIDAIDDSIPEANMFIAMSGEYYLPLANALFILALASGYKLIYRKEKAVLLCGLSLFLLGAIYIYGLVPAVIIITVMALYRGYSENKIVEAISTLAKLSLFCVPIAGYFIWLMLKFPTMSEDGWFSFPSLPALITSFGYSFIFVLIGLFLKNRVELIKESVLLLWVSVTLFLIYVPQNILPIQIQMLIGLGAPLAIMFATSLESISRIIISKVSSFSKQWSTIIAFTFSFSLIALSSLTNFKFYVQQFERLKEHNAPMFLDTKVYNAMEWVSTNIGEQKTFIVSRKLSFIFSSITACNVYTGVGRFRQKTREQNNTEQSLNLFHVNEEEQAKEMLKKTGADYLFLEKSLAGSDFTQLRDILKNSYKECFANDEVLIVQLK